MSDTVLSTARAGRVLTLTLNRPHKLNAFDRALTQALLAALVAADADASVGVIVIAGAGRAFSAGQDLAEFVTMLAGAERVGVAEHLRRGYNAVVTRIRAIEKPVIASMGGVAAGVGLSIALCCDLRIASDDAMLTLGFSKIGLIPDGGASFFLPLLAGFGRGLELAWSSERLNAAEAYRLGLVNRVVPAADLANETAAFAQRFAAGSPIASALTKRAFNEAILPNFTTWLEREALLQEEAAAGADFSEGMAAFGAKREPAFAPR